MKHAESKDIPFAAALLAGADIISGGEDTIPESEKKVHHALSPDDENNVEIESRRRRKPKDPELSQVHDERRVAAQKLSGHHQWRPMAHADITDISFAVN